MVRKVEFHERGIFIAITMFLVSIASILINNGEEIFSVVCISSGFAIGFTVVYGKVSLPILSITMFVGYIVGLLIVGESNFFAYILYPISHIVGLLFGGLLFRDFLIKNEAYGETSAKGVMFHIVGTVIVLIVASLITFIIMLPIRIDLGINAFFKVLIGYSTGFAMFGVLILLIYNYEDDIYSFENATIWSIVFVSMYIVFGVIVYSYGGTFGNIYAYGYIFIFFFFISGILFSLRQLLLLVSVYILLYQLNIDVIRDLPGDFSINLLLMNFFVIFLASLAMVIRAILYENQWQNETIKVSEERLEKTLIATRKILQVGEYTSRKTDTSLYDYMKEIFDAVTQIFTKYDAASCYIKDGNVVKFIDAKNYEVSELNSYGLSVDDFVWDIKEAIHVKNAYVTIESAFGEDYNEFSSKYPELKEHISFRVYIEGGQIGGISMDLYRTNEESYTKEDIAFISNFQSIVNSYYEFNKLRDTNSIMKDEIVLSLIHALELYDEYTSGHSEEVAYLSKEIGKMMGLSKEEYDELYWAGIVHDIGKVGIPSEIINKKAKLTEEEYSKVKEHSTHGFNIVNKSSELAHVAKIIKHHHEWYNGSGYPDGLKDLDIPLGSRILTVCDAVSSMAKQRPYSKAKNFDEIKEEILLYNESQFCPAVVEQMVKFIDSGKLEKYYNKL